MATRHLFAAALVSGLIAANAASAQAPLRFACVSGFMVTLAPNPQYGPFTQTNTGADCAMWQTFIFLNWPAAKRGIPNPNAKFGGPGATVWETYKTVDQVFLPNGVKPPGWDQNAGDPALPASIAADAVAGNVRALSQRSKVSHTVADRIVPADAADAAGRTLLEDIKQTGGLVLYDQQDVPVFYEIAMNKTQFDYIVGNGLYNADTQLAYTKNTNIVLPFGSIEVKAAWKVMTPAEIRSGRFHTIPAYIPSLPQPQVTVGLVGFHINAGGGPSKPGRDYTIGVWGTFAHVDNAPRKDTPITQPYTFYSGACLNCPVNDPKTKPTQVVQMFADDPPADVVNKQAQAMIRKYDAKNPWQYYKLINSQWSPRGITPPTPAMVPLRLGIPSTMTLTNPVLETFIQQSGKNCSGCHAYGGIAKNPKVGAGFSFMFFNAQAPPKP